MIKKLILALLFCFVCLLSYADTVTYYFNAYDTGEQWTETPEKMVDNNTSNYAGGVLNDIELLNGNTCPGTDLGTISKVELRANGGAGGSYDRVYLRPVFSGGDGDNHDIGEILAAWSAYIDITSDTNAPSWTWSTVQNLDCDVENYQATGGEGYAAISKVEIRVTYAVSARRIIMVQ